LDSARESEVMQRLFSMNQGPLSNSALHYIYKEIISASREIQGRPTIACLGPEASFTHMAAVTYYGRSVSYAVQSSISDVFREVEKGACHYGVVPVENLIAGSVTHTLDLFFESDVKICTEIYYKLSHDLLSRTGVLEDVKVIYAHPHDFAQCRKWVGKHLPGARFEECGSTAEAARKALPDPDSGAIGGREAALMLNLEVAASRIEDLSRNTTRFLVIGHDAPGPTDADKTSIMFATPHVPGALYKALEPFAKAEINMVKHESRPTALEGWSYFFFVDIEGHIEDPRIKAAVDDMKPLCAFLKHLGSYPRFRNE
ncbi:MAG: prephenate dehydratase, partial [Desulfobacterales bacterium]|nr:prephenate dehydratase [Desulfobacterales bacterium]